MAPMVSSMGAVRVHAMLIIQINHVHLQPAQAPFTSRADVGGLAADAAHRRTPARAGRGWIAHDAELGGQHHLAAATLNGAAHKFLIQVRAVNIRRIQQGYSQVQRAMNRGNGFPVVARAVEFRHAHAAQSHG